MPAVSLFTPTHNPAFLMEAYESLKAQTFTDFEWVLVPNQGAVIPDEILRDTRTKVHPYPSKTAPGIGMLKRYACDRAVGGLLVEFDHDDLLVEIALERIVQAHAETKAGFLYSDFVNFYPDQNSHVYTENHGWRTYPTTWRKRAYTAMSAFDPTPSSLSSIYYAPNHVRVWTREAYQKVEGHNCMLALCDDMDLIVRTYLAGVPFHHIKEPLYFYREQNQPDAANTYRQNLERIKRESQKIANKNFQSIAYEWVRREGVKAIELLSYGKSIGHEPLWIDEWNRNKKLPFEDSCAGIVRAYDFLNRVGNEDRLELMNEIYRVLCPGGFLLARAPSADGLFADADPMTRSKWNDMTFQYFCNAGLAGTVPGIKCRFQDTRVWSEFFDNWHRDHRMLHTFAEIAALKGQRQPGPVYW